MSWSGSNFSDFEFETTVSRGPSKTPKRHIQQSTSANNGGITMLGQLHVGSTATVVGVIIAKESPRSIFSKKNSGSERFLLNFTLRDTPADFINVTCWGQEVHILSLAKSFYIGDVVMLSSVYVQPNPTDGSDERFRVSTPLPYHITLSENHSTMSPYSDQDIDQYISLLNIPTKATTDYYTLEDIMTNGQTLNGEHINILAVVRKLSSAKEITTKAGKHTKRCEVKLFDESCSSFPLVLWGEELADGAQGWIPMETVLFVADVRMKYDEYRSGMVATADSKTVFTLNPDCVDAACLHQFAQTQEFDNEEDTDGNHGDPPLDQITTMVTAEELTQGSSVDYAILYGVFTKFDLDTECPEHFIRHRCTKCRQLVTAVNRNQCLNPDCSQGVLQMFNQTGEVTGSEPEMDFSLPVDISDHTGTIHSRLTGPVLKNMTGWNLNEFVNLEIDKRTDLKWNYLLQRCKFYIKVQNNFRDPGQLIIRIMSCSRADPADLQQWLNHQVEM